MKTCEHKKNSEWGRVGFLLFFPLSFRHTLGTGYLVLRKSRPLKVVLVLESKAVPDPDLEIGGLGGGGGGVGLFAHPKKFFGPPGPTPGSTTVKVYNNNVCQ